MRLAIIGAGWAGLAAAIQAVCDGHRVTVFEASRSAGGRARAIPGQDAHGALDNGQHILIGAYSECLRLMDLVGMPERDALVRLPLSLEFPDGRGLVLPPWPAPWDALSAIARARGWNWRDKAGLLIAATGWQRKRFQCGRSLTVTQLCSGLTDRVMRELIEPLCVSALNTPAPQASAEVFLRVLRDALFGVRGGSNLLLPKVNLSQLFPDAAQRWLQQRGATVRLGCRIEQLGGSPTQWLVAGERFDTVLLACPPWAAADLMGTASASAEPWLQQARALRHEAIATVYAMTDARLNRPMVALRSGADAPAQFVFDRGQLGGPPGLLAWVVSASQSSREVLQQQVTTQARRQLGLDRFEIVQTVVERRATFACTAGLQRPMARVAPGLLACGDYVAGPYPATLEGAVRSGVAAALMLRADRTPDPGR